MLNRLAGNLNPPVGPQPILRGGLDRLIQTMDMQAGIAFQLTRGASGQDVLELVAQSGLPAEDAELLGPLLADINNTAAVAGEPRIWQVETRSEPLIQRLCAQGFKILLTLPLRAEDRIVGGIILATKNPMPVPLADASILMAMGDQIGTALDIALLYEAEQDRCAESERRRRVAEALRDILAKLNSNLSLEEILANIAQRASDLLACDAIAFFRLDKAAGLLTLQASRGLDEDYAQAVAVPVGKGAGGRSIVEGRPAVIPDTMAILEEVRTWSDDPRWPRLAEEDARRYRALLAVPLFVKGEAYGAITLAYQTARVFSQEEIELAESFGDQVALAIESASLRQMASQAAVLAERGRLARELHDSVTQGLYSVTMYAEAAARLLSGGRVREASDHLHKVEDIAQEALREMRLLIFELRPVELEKNGLVGALQARLESVEMRGGMRAELRVEGEPGELPLILQEELYHIAREALNNILKHAHAQRVDVRLQVTQSDCLLEVKDDGVGFNPAERDRGGGLGFRGMRERAERLGATLNIEAAPGQGTRICLMVARPSVTTTTLANAEHQTRTIR